MVHMQIVFLMNIVFAKGPSSLDKETKWWQQKGHMMLHTHWTLRAQSFQIISKTRS